MEIKIVSKTIQTEVYVTSDGIEYGCEKDAVLHEKKLKAESLFGIGCPEVNTIDNTYVIVCSQDELDLLYDYICEVCGCYCQNDCDLDRITFPALVVYSEEADLYVVEDVIYRDSKHLCEMYEKMLERKQVEQ